METKSVVKSEKNITDAVLNKVKTLEQEHSLQFPPNYSYANALKAAWLKLQEVVDKNKQKALGVCTKESIANALLDMVVQGLSPAKNQCYFIVYGKTLVLMRSYLGTIAVTKRVAKAKDIVANVIYQDDKFSFAIDPETGLKKIVEHQQSFQSLGNANIVGAYAVITREGMPPFVEIMTIDQIKTAWGQGATKGGSLTHKNFAEEMAKKTVINRACKTLINTSDDSDLILDAVNRTTANEYEVTDAKGEVKAEIEQNANVQEIDFEEEETIEEPKEESQEEVQETFGPGF